MEFPFFIYKRTVLKYTLKQNIRVRCTRSVSQVWFSAQRLKHGVSWTPEEVEEARRKQFNGTVHTVPQTITVIPAHQLSAANGLQSILQTCQIVGQPGLVFTQVGKEKTRVTFDPALTCLGLLSFSPCLRYNELVGMSSNVMQRKE